MKKESINTTKKSKQKIIKYKNEDTNEIKKLLLILLGIIAIVFLLFFITSKYLLKDGFQKEQPSTKSVEIDYTSVDVGTMFNRPYEEYLVFAFNANDDNNAYYHALISTYTGKVKLYSLDLSILKNKEYVKEEANKEAKNISELAFGKLNLIHIKNGKIVEYLTDIKDIEKKLK